MNLHDWIDELCDVLDVETEVDEGLVLDLARVAAHNVQPARRRRSRPTCSASPPARATPTREEIEQLAAQAQVLADGWDRPAGAPDPDDIDDEVPDDSAVDHTGEDFEDEKADRRRPRHGGRMRAVIASGTGGPEVLSVGEVPDPSRVPARSWSTSRRPPSTAPTCCSGRASTRRRPARPT